ncbi:MAG: D-alanyl-D-alanine carboxypeptidase/D-alanyl-D-alanine-endopeptidase, partial [Acidobacteriota bacterium]
VGGEAQRPRAALADMRRAALAMFLLAVPGIAADLRERIAAAVASAPPAVRGMAGIQVVNLATREFVYSLNENQLFLPASNMKLFTAALALTRLGPDYRFTTRLVREASGSLVLIGIGDPSLSARVYPYRANATPGNPLQAIEALADQAIANGLRRVDGDLIGDDRNFPWVPYPESWTADDIEHDFGAPVSALTLNDNTVTVIVHPGARAGDLARIEISPAVEYFTLDNRISTSGNPSAVQVKRVPGTRQLLLSGTVRTGTAAIREIVPVDDPALFAAHALYETLLRRGIPIRGRPVARHTVPEAPVSGGEPLAEHISPPLHELLQTMMKVSQNLHAELLLRAVGSYRQSDATIAGGLKEMRALLTEAGIATADWRSEDASGLARNDEVTPHAITQLLAYMLAKPEWRETWLSLLPVGGQDGTLSDRLCCMAGTTGIRAKTGSLSRAVALSGYADSPRNGRLAFSILVNSFAAPTSEVRAWVDRVATRLIE